MKLTLLLIGGAVIVAGRIDQWVWHSDLTEFQAFQALWPFWLLGMVLVALGAWRALQD